MGAWGIGVYDNDYALDYVADIVDMAYGRIDYVEQGLVWLDLVEKFNAYVSQEQLNYVKELINDEIENISNWRDTLQDDRKKLLTSKLEFIEIISGNK